MKDFTGQKHGANKFIYSKRKVFWEGVTKLIQQGHLSETDFNKDYSAYKVANSVSTILTAMRKDSMNVIEKIL